MNTPLDVRPPTNRKVLHASITVEQIFNLVDEFYFSVFEDERLGAIFMPRIKDNLGVHLNKMKAFWRSVLLKTGEYKGQPVPVHNKIDGITIDDFQKWLELFAQTALRIFDKEAAPLIINAAKRMASSLWLARHSDPFATPPDWQLNFITNEHITQEKAK
jgi:hemoglobin